jgi:broad specificity phosphatase PhoE
MGPFYFLRHGETEWNVEGRFCGRTDVPLSEVGRRQARLLALRVKPLLVESLYSSPLRRALETARLIGEVIGREPVVDPRLTELNYGAWEGLDLEEIKRAGPAIYEAWKRDPGSLAPPQGESGVQLIERVMPFLRDVAQRHPGGNVMVVCHKTVCRLLACHFMGVPLAEYRQAVRVENAALNVFEMRTGIWRVVGLNDTSHLTEQ